MRVSKSSFRFFLWIGLLFCLELHAQTNVPLLEKKVTLFSSNEPVEEVLKSISQQGGFTFSYGPQVLAGMKPVTIQAKSKPVRSILNSVFTGQVTFKEKGNHIILLRISPPKEAVLPIYFFISGYIVDGLNGNQLEDVSIFEKNSRVSTISNDFGYFTLKVNKKDAGAFMLLNINKANYKDTIFYIKQTGSTHLNIVIYPEEIIVSNSDSLNQAINDSILGVEKLAFVKLFLNKEEELNSRNIKDTLYRKSQLSFLPFIGTNLRLSGNTVNDYSLNILGGYSFGTRKLELAGLFNIDRDSVKNLQAAGLFNVVGHHTNGVQAAGLVNLNMGTVHGTLFSGLLNVNKDSIRGAEFAGLINVNLKPAGGLQMAGLMNVNLKEVHGLQAAGLMNVSLKKSTGAQIAGLMNVAAGDIYGAQISGLLNFGMRVHGSQIGVFNFADSMSGVPVGLLSFVRKGYHELEVSANESYPLNVSFRTGVRSFYNIVEAGMKFSSDTNQLWYFGYGLGTAANLGKQWQLNIDLSMNQPVKGNELNNFNPLAKLNVTFEKRFSRYFSLAAGPSLNVFFYKLNDPSFGDMLEKIPPSFAFNTDISSKYKRVSWIGAKIALRFF
jgi:hypothetical protein